MTFQNFSLFLKTSKLNGIEMNKNITHKFADTDRRCVCMFILKRQYRLGLNTVDDQHTKYHLHNSPESELIEKHQRYEPMPQAEKDKYKSGCSNFYSSKKQHIHTYEIKNV